MASLSANLLLLHFIRWITSLTSNSSILQEVPIETAAKSFCCQQDTEDLELTYRICSLLFRCFHTPAGSRIIQPGPPCSWTPGPIALPELSHFQHTKSVLWQLSWCSHRKATEGNNSRISQALANFQQHPQSKAPASSKAPQAARQAAKWEPPSSAAGSLSNGTTHHFILVLLQGSVSASSAALLERGPSPSSAKRALNFFCSCRTTGGRVAILLVPEVTCFQPSPSQESLFPQLISTESAYTSFSIVGG